MSIEKNGKKQTSYDEYLAIYFGKKAYELTEHARKSDRGRELAIRMNRMGYVNPFRENTTDVLTREYGEDLPLKNRSSVEESEWQPKHGKQLFHVIERLYHEGQARDFGKKFTSFKMAPWVSKSELKP